MERIKKRVYCELEGTEVMDLRTEITNLLIALEENDIEYATRCGQTILKFLKRLPDRFIIKQEARRNA